MTITNDLDIFIITYNRASYLDKTIQKLLCMDSPIKDCQITILDNASTDNTKNIVAKHQNKNTNLRYIKNNRNLGAVLNIIKAMELADKKWLWILGDDDDYDWSAWPEIEDALNKDYDAVNTCWHDGAKSNEYKYLLNESGFIATSIVNTKHLTSTTLQNAAYNSISMDPHSAIMAKIINEKGKIYVPEKKLCIENLNNKDNSNIIIKDKLLHHDILFYNIIYSKLKVYQLIKDKKQRYECNEILVLGKNFEFSMDVMLGIGLNNRRLTEVFFMLSPKQKLILFKVLIRKCLKSVYSKKKTDTHKIYKILGIKFKVKRKDLKKVCYWLDSNQAGIIPMRENHIYACCTRAVPILVDKQYNYDELSYDDIQKKRIKLYEDINSGRAPQCEGCDCLINKPAKKIDISKISYLIYHPHTTCNLQCCYCFFQKDEQYAKLDPRTADLYAAVKNFHKIGLFKDNIQLELGGGEPLLLNNIDKTYDFMAENYPKGGIVLVSNYALSNRVDTIIPIFKQRKIKTTLKTSIDCGTRETYTKIRNRDVFEDVINNITRSAKEGIFDTIYLKYILLEDGSNTSDKDIYGFIEICRQVADRNPNKTSIIIDADMRAISEDGDEYFKTKEGEFTTFKPHLIKDDMLRAAGIIYKSVTDDLGLDVIWTGDRLSAVSKEGLQDIDRIKDFAKTL